MFPKTLTEHITLLSSFLINKILYRKTLASDVKKILIVKLDHIGDVLLATPVITNLKLRYPQAHIAILVGSWSKSIVESNPYLDEIFCYDAPFFCRNGKSTPFKRAIKLLRQLRKEQFDLLVELRGNLLTLTLAASKGGKYRLDRATQRTEGKLFNLSLSNHEVEINLDTLKHADIPIKSYETCFYVPQEYQVWAKRFLKRVGVLESKPITAIHPASPVLIKRWLPERFAELADILIEEFDAQILFLGLASEKEVIAEIQSLMKFKSFSIAGQTSLPQLAGILQNCQLYIGNDSGPMHLAATLNTPVIGLFGPSSPQRFGPHGSNCIAIRKTDCPPCMKERCSSNGRGCIAEITVKDVINGVYNSIRFPRSSHPHIKPHHIAQAASCKVS